MDQAKDHTPHDHQQPKPEKGLQPKRKPDTDQKPDLEHPARPKVGARDNPPPDMAPPGMDPGDEDDHVGATEDEVSRTPAPTGSAFEDEPRQG
jgi:hypothetical protein